MVMKIFLKDTALAVGVQAILVAVSFLLFFLFKLPEAYLWWLRIYAPATLLVMGILMGITTSRNLILALGLGFLLGASLYGAIFSFFLSSYRKHRALNRVSTTITPETNSPENLID